jgi:hypothetical protein
LHFKCADIDAIIHYTRKTGTSLIVIGRRSEIRIATFNSRAGRKQRVGKSRTAVVLERPEQRVGVDLVARAGQIAASIIIADIISV